MKKLIVLLSLLGLLTDVGFAQEIKSPNISVLGEGKIKVTPDQVKFTVAIENTGKSATEVKKLNDETIKKAMSVIKKFQIAASDYKTTQVYFSRYQDTKTKKEMYRAYQSMEILVKKWSDYDAITNELMQAGMNNLQQVEFLSSQMETLKSDARKAAMRDALQKAKDYLEVLGHKVGKPIQIVDQFSSYYPPPRYKNVMMAMEMETDAVQETLAPGEIEIKAQVQVYFGIE